MAAGAPRVPVPLVASLFLRLPSGKVKHRYDWKHSPRVDAPYRLWCTQPDCDEIKASRAGLAPTEIVPWSFEALSASLAAELNVSVHALHHAARLSETRVHCPSKELILIWLAKMLVVKQALAAHAERHEFAWVDVGWNVYRVKRIDPPPAPWTRFWPAAGSLAVARIDGSCHNALRGTNYSRCPVGTYMYGGRAGWDRLLPLYFRRVRQLVLAADASRPRALLCMDQDIFEDVARMPEPRRHRSPLFDEFEVSRSSSNWGGWGWEGAAPCPVVISLVSPSSVLAGCPVHWGHEFAGLIFGIDAALRSHAALLVDDAFWDGLSDAGERPAETSAERAPPWPWRALRFNRTSQAGALGLAGLPRLGFPGVTRPTVRRAPRVAHAAFAKHRRTEEEALLDSRNGTRLLEYGFGYSYQAFNAQRQCHRHYRLHTSLRSCEHAHYCHTHIPGAWDRATLSPVFRRAVHEGLEGWLGDRGAAAGDPVRVVWHVRTGDLVLAASAEALARLNGSVAAGLGRRAVEHAVVSSSASQLAAAWPHLAPLHRAGSSAEEDVARMASADVLVTVGSSFGIAAAALAPLGQLHLFFPPKEVTYGVRAAELGGVGAGRLQQHSAFQTYFMRRNTVPLTFRGEPFPAYEPKMRAMLGAIGSGRRPAAAEACAAAGEAWLDALSSPCGAE